MTRKSDLHQWDLEPQEAVALQRRLASRVRQGRPRWRKCFEGLRVAGAEPLYVSVGHMIDLETATDLVLACCRRYRLPEPTRLAHHAAGLLR